MDYFPDDYITVIDESHVAVPQLTGSSRATGAARTLVEHGFRLPSAADNRPLRFDEGMERTGQVICMSATPGAYERAGVRSGGASDRASHRVGGPRSDRAAHQGTDRRPLGRDSRAASSRDQRVLVTTLTKKMAEDLTDYLLEMGVRVRYLHSEVDTIERIEILRELRMGDFDVLVGINLLREGLDLPEVSLVAILDADKEGFLRSDTSLIQIIGRAARNVDGQVVMYADSITSSMDRAIGETNRRRNRQLEYNQRHGIDPQTIRKRITDILELVASEAPAVERRRGPRVDRDVIDLTGDDLSRVILSLEEEMRQAAAELRFEYAARLRDEVAELKKERRQLSEVLA